MFWFGKQEKRMSEKLKGESKILRLLEELLIEILESKGTASCFKLSKHFRTIKMPVTVAHAFNHSTRVEASLVCVVSSRTARERETLSQRKKINKYRCEKVKEKSLVGQKSLELVWRDRGEGMTLRAECFLIPADRLRRRGNEEALGVCLEHWADTLFKRQEKH